MEESLWEERLNEPAPVEDVELNSLSSDAQGLVNLGYLTEDITIAGNDISLRTLYIGEELEIGLLTKPWQGNVEEGRAYATALVAAMLTRVNGREVVAKLGPSDKDHLQRKFNYIKNNYTWPIIEEIYKEAVVPLIQRQSQVLNELQSK